MMFVFGRSLPILQLPQLRRYCVSEINEPIRFYWTRKAAQARFDERAAFRDARVGLYTWQSMMGRWVPVEIKHPGGGWKVFEDTQPTG